jgi:hypothetical protein
MQFRKEPMWECSYQYEISRALLDIMAYEQGCIHCFPEMNDFREYLETNNIIRKVSQS